MRRLCVISLSLFLVANLPTGCLVSGQNFDPNLEDEEYLNQTERKVKHEVVTARQDLIDQVETVRVATRAYIGAKIKENLFKALRTVAEKELETFSMQTRPRQPRQDDDDDDDTTPEPGIIPQLATIVQAIFGPNVNVTKYIENVSKLLPRPIGNQLVGVASLLDPNQFTSTVEPELSQQVPITPPPRRFNYTSAPPPQLEGGLLSSINNSSSFQSSGENGTTIASKVPLPPVRLSARPPVGTTIDDEDNIRGEEDTESEDDYRKSLYRVKRQFNLNGLHPMKLLDGFESIWKNFGMDNSTATTPASIKSIKGGSTTESEDGFDDDYTTKPSRVNTAVKGVATQMEALRKGVPDLFLGAREAYKFLEHLNGFLDNWENRLLGGNADDD